jgi:Ribonuclease G/E
MSGSKKAVLDKDMAKVGTALRRAAKQARKIALQTKTPLVVYENGRVIKKRLDDKRARR